MIGIIDIGFGNIEAILDCFKSIDVEALRVAPKDMNDCDGLVLPGVGHFKSYMNALSKSGWETILKNELNDKPLLGICVGMHALSNFSDESNSKGLNLIPGNVKKINSQFPLPHMGWNSILATSNHQLLQDIDLNKGFYFLHNYAYYVDNKEAVVAESDYGNPIQCVISRGNIFGVQFHPEKSHKNGLKLFLNFSKIAIHA